MKKIIRLTESELMKLVENAAMKVLNEDGEALGSGGMVDMRPTMKRHDGKGGSISIPKNKA